MTEYILHIAIIIFLYTMLSQSLVLTSGYSGLLSLAHAGFFGIGAYTAGLLSTKLGLSFIIILPLAILISCIIAVCISVVALRTVEEYFIIITLGIQVISFSIMNNWMTLTNGPLGIPGIPFISIFGFDINDKKLFLILTIILASLVFFILKNVTQSPFGRILIALSEDEIFTQSLGKSVYLSKIISFSIGGMLAAIPGVLYAYYVSYIDPSSFTIDESIFILSIAIIGGMRNLNGSLLASSILILLPEILRLFGITDTIAANIRQILYGTALVIIMMKYKNFKSLQKT